MTTKHSKVNVRVVKASAPSGATKQLYEDPFKTLYGEIIEPPYNQKELKQIGEYSTILQQCIEAYKTNIVGFGLEPVYRFDYNDPVISKEKKAQADKEWTQLEEFVEYMNFDEDAEEIIGFAIEDREKTGNGYIEVLRDGTNKPAGIEFMDCQYIRVCKSSKPIEIEVTILENGAPKKIKRYKKFRKYVQDINGKKVYFKEYGDPRHLDSETGEYSEEISEEKRATEVIHFKIGSGAYGIPRWIGHLINLYGARKAEELNWLYFKQGRHIPAAITVENGQLSEESYTQLQEYMNDLEGSDNAHKFLLLEVEGLPQENHTGEEKPTPVKVEIKSLAEMLQKDALFLDYDEKSRNKLRSAFRLPPIYTGESQDYNKSTSETARKITEEQVFRPERNKIVGKLNTLFLSDLELYQVKFRLKGPSFGDPIDTAKALHPIITAGGVTPNDLRDLLGELLGRTIEELPVEYNVPIQVLLRNLEQTPMQLPLLKSKENNGLVNILKDIRDVLEDIEHGKNR